MTGFDRRLKELLEKVRARAEAEGLQWRKADKDVYAFRAGSYVMAFAKNRDPMVAIYDENGEELEAIDRADLEGRPGDLGRVLAETQARIWRLGRRGAGVSAAALDHVLDWLDQQREPAAHAAPAESPRPAIGAVYAGAHEGHPEAGLSPQAPQAGLTPQADLAPQADDLTPQAGETPQAGAAPRPAADHHPGSNGNGPIRPPWAQ